MWNIERELGNGEKLIKCSECGYQEVVKELPDECSNCGEPAEEEVLVPRNIDTRRSSIDLRDIEEPAVVEYEKDTPVYKLWYFWLILVFSICIILGGAYFAKNFLMEIRTPEENPDGTNVNGVEMTIPTGWGIEEGVYYSPDGSASVTVYTHNVSKFLKTEDAADLVKELSGTETMTDKASKDIEGKLLTREVESVDAEGKKITATVARYVFVQGGKLYMITYRSDTGDMKVFEDIIGSIVVEK